MDHSNEMCGELADYLKSYLKLYETRDLWVDEDLKDPEALVCIVVINNKEMENGPTIVSVSDKLDKAKQKAYELWKSHFPKLEEKEVADFSQLPLEKVLKILEDR